MLHTKHTENHPDKQDSRFGVPFPFPPNYELKSPDLSGFESTHFQVVAFSFQELQPPPWPEQSLTKGFFSQGWA